MDKDGSYVATKRVCRAEEITVAVAPNDWVVNDLALVIAAELGRDTDGLVDVSSCSRAPTVENHRRKRRPRIPATGSTGDVVFKGISAKNFQLGSMLSAGGATQGESDEHND